LANSATPVVDDRRPCRSHRSVELEAAMTTSHAGGCLCGAVRYEARGEPLFAGCCYCKDCQKASGSGFVPFMGFAAKDVRFSGQTRLVVTKAANGGDAHRNFCPNCGSLVFGGIVGVHDQHTIYAGSLDDNSLFEPQFAIFNRSRPPWAPLPEGLQAFEAMPG
jgi:hypothetical protein